MSEVTSCSSVEHRKVVKGAGEGRMFQLVWHILEGNGLAVRGRRGTMIKRSVRKLLNYYFFLRCALTVYLGLKLAMFLPLLTNDWSFSNVPLHAAQLGSHSDSSAGERTAVEDTAGSGYTLI